MDLAADRKTADRAARDHIPEAALFAAQRQRLESHEIVCQQRRAILAIRRVVIGIRERARGREVADEPVWQILVHVHSWLK